MFTHMSLSLLTTKIWPTLNLPKSKILVILQIVRKLIAPRGGGDSAYERGGDARRLT